MLFRALVLQAFGEENLPYEDYQDYPWHALSGFDDAAKPSGEVIEAVVPGITTQGQELGKEIQSAAQQIPQAVEKYCS